MLYTYLIIIFIKKKESWLFNNCINLLNFFVFYTRTLNFLHNFYLGKVYVIEIAYFMYTFTIVLLDYNIPIYIILWLLVLINTCINN